MRTQPEPAPGPRPDQQRERRECAPAVPLAWPAPEGLLGAKVTVLLGEGEEEQPVPRPSPLPFQACSTSLQGTAGPGLQC